MRPLLELEDVHTYYGDSHILKGISMNVEAGEVVGLLGRNGTGKTTTLRSITGVQSPRRGTIRFDGEDVTGEDVVDISKRGIKLVPEDRRLFADMTVRENLQISKDTTYSSNWTTERVVELLPRIEERIDQRAGTLSGGEQQMVAIAQALLANPRLILLDEPMEGLAPQIVEQIISAIEEITQTDIPIVIVEQDLSICLELIDRGYVLHKGEVKMQESSAGLSERADEVEQYLSVAV